MDERAADVVALQRALTLLVRRTAVPRAHERVVRRAGVEIDLVEAVALSRIVDAGSLRLRALADGLGVASSTAGRHAANLDRRGLCVRTPDPADARGVIVEATAAGRRLVERLRAAHAEELGDLLVDWTDAELGNLARLVGRLADDLAGLGTPRQAAPA